jgi:SAM-dependent methyltransferase
MLRNTFYRLYLATQRRLAPTLKYSQLIYEDEVSCRLKHDITWLDVGCGHHILPPWRQPQELALVSRCQTVVGLDPCLPALQMHGSIKRLVAGDISRLPFADGAFDLATANMVVEHLSDPLGQFCEVRRVLKPGGRFLFHTPNAFSYFCLMRRLVPSRLNKHLVRLLDGRPEEDVFPVQYKSNTAGRINDLARLTGFRVKRIKMLVSSPVFLFVPPVMVIELLLLRLLMLKSFKRWRTNIVAELEAC